jgi:hypothetical protein
LLGAAPSAMEPCSLPSLGASMVHPQCMAKFSGEIYTYEINHMKPWGT